MEDNQPKATRGRKYFKFFMKVSQIDSIPLD